MTSRDSNRPMPPQHLYDNYKRIRNSKLILNKSLDTDNIAEFQTYLNDAQPESPEDYQMRALIQYLYRKNPNNFCRFLVRSRLSHLILWTEAKCIVRHFGLRGVVYVKWNDDGAYECSLHRNVQSGTGADLEHPSVQKTIANIGKSEFTDRGYDRSGGQNRGYEYDNRSREDNQHRGETRYERDNRFGYQRNDSRGDSRGDSRFGNQRNDRYSRDGSAKRTSEPNKRFQRDYVRFCKIEPNDDTSSKNGASDGNVSPTKSPEKRSDDGASDTIPLGDTQPTEESTKKVDETNPSGETGSLGESESDAELVQNGVSHSYSKIAQSS